MDNIKNKISYLKNKIIREKETDQEIRSALKNAINKVFNGEDMVIKYLVDCHVNGKKIILETKNKVCANEFFLRKNQISAELVKSGLVKEIIIK